MLKTLFLVSFSFFLIGCNGKASKNDDNNFVAGSVVQVDENIKINQPVELLLFNPLSNASQLQWQQTAGEPVTFLADQSKAIAFTPTIAGEYSFIVNFTDDNGNQQLEHTLTVSDEISKVNARLGHAVLEGNKVSLSANLTSDVEPNSITWQQTSGPSVSFSEDNVEGHLSVFFDAPNVSQDTVLTFEVQAMEGDILHMDTVAVLVENAINIDSNAYFDERVANVFAYNAGSPFAQNTVECLYSNNLTSSCTFEELPLIAQVSSTPSVEDIMDRVIVSHQWMGDRFKDFLNEYDNNDDFKNLLRATTGIVISYDIRPSFYWAATGAIYLDASNFWLTPDERDTINDAPDYRADFGDDLQFVMPWRFVKDNDYASESFPKEDRATRSSQDALYRLASLMYHELSHANDFFPSNEWFTHNPSDRILDAALSTDFESDALSISHPLNSDEMRSLANVRFSGETASSTQSAYIPEDIALFFSADHASDFYNYSSEREDYAMLFEELMMKVRYDINRDVAITNQPSGDNISSSDYIVTWGQRGRIGEDSIRTRVAFVAERVLPEFNSGEAIDNLQQPIQMISGNDWYENLTISVIPTTNNLKRMRKKNISPVGYQYNYFEKPLPNH